MPVKNPADPATWTVAINGKVWTPTRSGSPLSRAFYQLEQELQRDRRRGPKVVDKTSGAAVVTTAGLPKQVVSCSATENPSTQVDRSFSQVAVSFTRDPGDQNFAGVHIWFTGYKGNNQPVLMTDAADSPVIFLCETTKENVTVIVQPFNGGHVAAPFAGAKTCAVALDGVSSAPPAPTISQLTAAVTSGATTLGQQFTFTPLQNTDAYVIQGYWVYRAGSSTTPVPPASRLRFIPADQYNRSDIVVSDLSGVSTNYFWISAVDKSGLESPLAAAGTTGGGGGGGTTTTFRPSAATAVQSAFTNPSNVWDGNSSTYASATSSHASGATFEDSWQGFPAGVGSASSVKLKCTSQASVSGSGDAVTIKLRYSLDGGATYTSVFQTSVSRALTTDVITLPNAQDLTQVKVDFFVSVSPVLNGTSNATGKLYEVWIERTV